jgi:uncharacterized protein YqjF (DUF2071 family)
MLKIPFQFCIFLSQVPFVFEDVRVGGVLAQPLVSAFLKVSFAVRFEAGVRASMGRGR